MKNFGQTPVRAKVKGVEAHRLAAKVVNAQLAIRAVKCKAKANAVVVNNVVAAVPVNNAAAAAVLVNNVVVAAVLVNNAAAPVPVRDKLVEDAAKVAMVDETQLF